MQASPLISFLAIYILYMSGGTDSIYRIAGIHRYRRWGFRIPILDERTHPDVRLLARSMRSGAFCSAYLLLFSVLTVLPSHRSQAGAYTILGALSLPFIKARIPVTRSTGLPDIPARQSNFIKLVKRTLKGDGPVNTEFFKRSTFCM